MTPVSSSVPTSILFFVHVGVFVGSRVGRLGIHGMCICIELWSQQTPIRLPILMVFVPDGALVISVVVSSVSTEETCLTMLVPS